MATADLVNQGLSIKGIIFGNNVLLPTRVITTCPYNIQAFLIK